MCVRERKRKRERERERCLCSFLRKIVCSDWLKFRETTSRLSHGLRIYGTLAIGLGPVFSGKKSKQISVPVFFGTPRTRNQKRKRKFEIQKIFHSSQNLLSTFDLKGKKIFKRFFSFVTSWNSSAELKEYHELNQPTDV